jgi:MTH538 TIR-like domain (DUF1863)
MSEKFRVALKLCLDGRDFIFPKAKRETGLNGQETIRAVVCAYQADSRCLIVFSGKKSLTHPWINKEIEWWCERYGVEKVYFALTHGDVPLDEERRPILKEMMPAEDRAAQLSPHRPQAVARSRLLIVSAIAAGTAAIGAAAAGRPHVRL